MSNVKIYTATPADLSPPVQSESFCVDLVLASDYRELEAKCAAQVLEQFAAQQEAISKKYPTGSYGQESAYDAAQCAREFAEQLRQGVAQ
ncbi:hypothetical protein RBN93_001263 [Salmonella enterica]|nr:hypothetical protein [Salmonella enterica]